MRIVNFQRLCASHYRIVATRKMALLLVRAIGSLEELVSNILVHREYSSPVPAQITITNEGIETRNASRPVFEVRLI